MIFLFLGILVIVLGMSYRVYQIYFKIKNTQAKAIYEEIKKESMREINGRLILIL